MVSGSDLYKVADRVSAVPKARWASICTDCAGAIDSLVELLQGRFSKGVMERLCQQKTGLFPSPAEIEFSCSCPDRAVMCKHVAAVFNGIGARLDEHPELLFKLRKVDEKDLIAKAGKGLPLSKQGPAGDKVLAAEGLSELFGLEMGVSTDEPAVAAGRAPKRTATRTRRTAKRRAQPAAVEASPKAATRRSSLTGKNTQPKGKTKPKGSTKKGKTAKQ